MTGGIFYEVFHEVVALLGLAALCGILAQLLRQPLIVAFIAAGVVSGPSVLGWVQAADQVDLLAKLGIALLLFVVGLKLDIQLIRSMGRVALATGLGQVLFTSVVGYLIALSLGLTPVAALYVAVALTFSSTIIIVKLLSDKREIDALHGRIALGFLIVQDLVVVLVMIGLTAFAVGDPQTSLGRELLLVLAKGAGLLIGVAVLMRWVLPSLVRGLAKSPELLVLFAIAWAVSLAAASEWLGFSKEVGAFLAGIALASTPYREAISSRLVSLRDFLLLFFFIDLGAGLDLSLLGPQLVPALILSLFVLIGNPLIVMIIMGALGYRKRTGFMAGLTVAQISEFSLILAALGLNLGHIDADIVGLITLVGLITIGLSTYLILYSQPIYQRLRPWLAVFERRHAQREQGDDAALAQIDTILFGIGRYGNNLARGLRQRGHSVLGVDFDPWVVDAQRQAGVAVCYGDAEDAEFINGLPLRQARLVVSSLPQLSLNLHLLRALRAGGYQGEIVLTAHSQAEAELLASAGADRVLWPFVDAAERAAERLAMPRSAHTALAADG